MVVVVVVVVVVGAWLMMDRGNGCLVGCWCWVAGSVGWYVALLAQIEERFAR